MHRTVIPKSNPWRISKSHVNRNVVASVSHRDFLPVNCTYCKMYAPNLIRVFSYCNRSLIVSRQLLSSQSNLKSHNFVTIANNLHLKYKSLTSVSFSASSSPDDIRIKSKGDDKKKRRRIISSSSSDDNEKSSPNKSADDSK